MQRLKRFFSALFWIFTSKNKKIRDARIDHEVKETVEEVTKEIKEEVTMVITPIVERVENVVAEIQQVTEEVKVKKVF